MTTRTCNDPLVMAAVRDRVRGRRSGEGSAHVDRCDACGLEIERLQRLAASFEEAKPDASQVDRAWMRFDAPSTSAESAAPARSHWGWAFAAAAVLAAAGLVWAQWLRAPAMHSALSGTQPSSSVIAREADSQANTLSTSIAPHGPSQDELPAVGPDPRPRPNHELRVDAGPADLAARDETKARRMLEPRVFGGRATIDEVRMLRAICRHQKDADCEARARQVLNEMIKP